MSQLRNRPTLFERSSSEESEIVILSDSSDDESVSQTRSVRYSSREDTRSVRDLIDEARRLLLRAETKSQPEPFKSETATTFRYPFSSSVKVSDLYRDRDMTELLGLVSSLKSRLSAESVFAMGCPEHPDERKIYDELVMRYSDELLETSRNDVDGGSSIVSPTGEVRAHGFWTNLGHLNHQLAASSSRETRSSGNALHINENILKDFEAVAQTNSRLKNFGELLINVNKFCDLTSFDPKSIEDKLTDIDLQTVLNKIHSSLTAVLKIKSSDMSQVPDLPPSQRKRKRSGESDSKLECKKAKEQDNSVSHEEEETCSVCLEPWTTGGEHRVICLKCGHLFGLSCISKWVDQAHCCPQCKAPAKKSDLRNIFVTRITAEDTSERDRALRLLEEEKAARRQLEQKEALARHKLEMHAADNEAMRTELMQLRAAAGPSSVVDIPTTQSYPSQSQTATSTKRFHQYMRINIGQDANCRVFDYSRELGMVVVSMKSANPLFRGYGIKMFSRELKPLFYQPLHSLPIRDMCFRPGCFDGQLLSCGLDKCIQLTSVTSKVVIQKYTEGSTVWCCAWNTVNTNLFYAGMEKGVVREFDIRMTNGHVQNVVDSGGSPMSNIQYWNSGGEYGVHGLLIAHLQNVIFKQKENEQFISHYFTPTQAALTSLSLHNSGYYLASYRPGANLQKCRYEIYNFTQNVADQTISSTRQAVWDGGKMQVVISRNALISYPETDNSLLAVTANHSNNLVNVWDVNKKQELQSLPCYDKAIDIKAVPHNNGDLLGVLTEKELIMYKWRD